MESEQNCDPDAKKDSAAELNFFILSKMKNVAKIEIVLHDPYSNALWKGGCYGGLTSLCDTRPPWRKVSLNSSTACISQLTMDRNYPLSQHWLSP